MKINTFKNIVLGFAAPVLLMGAQPSMAATHYVYVPVPVMDGIQTQEPCWTDVSTRQHEEVTKNWVDANQIKMMERTGRNLKIFVALQSNEKSIQNAVTLRFPKEEEAKKALMAYQNVVANCNVGVGVNSWIDFSSNETDRKINPKALAMITVKPDEQEDQITNISVSVGQDKVMLKFHFKNEADLLQKYEAIKKQSPNAGVDFSSVHARRWIFTPYVHDMKAEGKRVSLNVNNETFALDFASVEQAHAWMNHFPTPASRALSRKGP